MSNGKLSQLTEIKNLSVNTPENIVSDYRKKMELCVDPWFSKGTTHWVEVESSVKIRAMTFLSSTERHIAVLYILPGRTEPIEKYKETLFDLSQMGFDLVILDHRGQGLSTRETKTLFLGHIHKFSSYVTDAFQVYEKLVLPLALNRSLKMESSKCNSAVPLFLMGHSLGGLVAFHLSYKMTLPLQGLILCSPMLSFSAKPIPKRAVQMVAKWKQWREDSESPAYTPIYPIWESYGWDLTSCSYRLENFIQLLKEHPQLVCGAPSMNWLEEAMAAERETESFDQALPFPSLVFAPLQDSVVDSEKCIELAARQPQCQLVKVPQAKHELFLERDFIRQSVLNKIQAFVTKTSKMNPFLQVPLAHRGLFVWPTPLPENSLPAFQRAMDFGFGMECDARLMKDKSVVVFHDEDLKRLCQDSRKMNQINKADLSELKWKGTFFSPPTLDELLELVRGQAPIMIELKSFDHDGFHQDFKLEKEVLKLLETYDGAVALKSFNPHSVSYLKDHAPPWIPVGFLSCCYEKDGDFPFLPSQEATSYQNLTHPLIPKLDFVSYGIEDLTQNHVQLLKKLGIPLFTWTIRTKAQFLKAKAWSQNVVFEWEKMGRGSVYATE